MINIIHQLPRHQTLRYRERDLKLIDGIAIHHSADNGDPWKWAEWHVNGRGWPGIGYHAAIMRDGRRYKTNYDRTRSYHVAGHNTHLIGIVLQGDLTRTAPTPEQISSLLWVVRGYMKAYPAIKPENIRGHGEWDPGHTQCPGTWLGSGLPAVLRALDWEAS